MKPNSAYLAIAAAAVLCSTHPAAAEEQEMIREVPPITAEPPHDGLVLHEGSESLKSHEVTVNGKPAEESAISLWGWSRYPVAAPLVNV